MAGRDTTGHAGVVAQGVHTSRANPALLTGSGLPKAKLGKSGTSGSPGKCDRLGGGLVLVEQPVDLVGWHLTH